MLCICALEHIFELNIDRFLFSHLKCLSNKSLGPNLVVSHKYLTVIKAVILSLLHCGYHGALCWLLNSPAPTLDAIEQELFYIHIPNMPKTLTARCLKRQCPSTRHFLLGELTLNVFFLTSFH